jgi:hypothetical protein
VVCFRYTAVNTVSNGDNRHSDNNNNNNNNNNNTPKPVYEEGDVTVLWNQAVHTDTEVTANRPDIIIKNKKEKTRTLIDVTIPADRNVVQKEAEKKLKYKRLGIEIQRMWNLKCTIVAVIIGATGIVTKSLRKKSGSYTRKAFDRFTTEDSCTWNITHNTESTAA